MAARIIGTRKFPADLANALVDAILALPVGLAGEARQRRQRTFEKPQDFAETDRIGGPTRICSRNLCGMQCREAISALVTARFFGSAAIASKARKAYFALFEIIPIIPYSLRGET